jgi:hypothetical protein
MIQMLVDWPLFDAVLLERHQTKTGSLPLWLTASGINVDLSAFPSRYEHFGDKIL